MQGDEHQVARKPLGQFPEPQNNTTPIPGVGSLSTKVHLQKDLPGLVVRPLLCVQVFKLCNLLRDPPVLDSFPVTPFPPSFGLLEWYKGPNLVRQL